MFTSRRDLLLGAAALCAAEPLVAQNRRWAALSLVGDKILIVGARPEIGSRISQNTRRWADDAENTLDRYVLQAIDRAVRERDRGAAVAMLALPGSALYGQPERAFDGRQVALPGAAVDALIAGRASHLLLATKLRNDARIPLYDAAVGVGAVAGIGFYVDTDLRLKILESGQAANGVLAPFVYVRLSLIDVQSGEVLREELVREMQTYPTALNPDAAGPWDVLGAGQKIDVLHKLIDKSIGGAADKLVRAG